jgi:hypothetical protein
LQQQNGDITSGQSGGNKQGLTENSDHNKTPNIKPGNYENKQLFAEIHTRL